MSLVSNLFLLFVAAGVIVYYLVPAKVAMAGAVGFQLYLLHSGRHQICWLSAVFHVCNLADCACHRKNGNSRETQNRKEICDPWAGT